MNEEFERHQMISVRLCPSIRLQATTIAQGTGVSLNYFISIAIAEKMDRLQRMQQNNGARISALTE